jgi:hypothetical protein
VAATIDSNTRTKDSTNHIGDTPKEETRQACRRLPEPKSDSRVSLGGRGREERSAHDDASKKVTAPVGVFVVHIT